VRGQGKGRASMKPCCIPSRVWLHRGAPGSFAKRNAHIAELHLLKVGHLPLLLPSQPPQARLLCCQARFEEAHVRPAAPWCGTMGI